MQNQQLNSSTAQQLNSSTAQQLNSRIASLLVIASMTAAVTGCEGMILGGKTGQAVVKSSATRTEVDAGIILADRESYLCLSFERLGLAEGDAVMSVNSSCECVQPSVVCYRSHQGREANAVLLQFLKENRKDTAKTELKPSGASVETPVYLGVLIGMKLADGSVRQFTVNLLPTSLVYEVAL